MHAFPTAPRARLTCRADFALAPVLNIDFLNPADGTIPFHLSLRRDEGVAVVNRRHAAGWRREIVREMTFGEEPLEIEITITPLFARIRLDGRPFARFDALPRPAVSGRYLLRHGFPGLGRIAEVRLEGALERGSLSLDCPGLPLPEPGCRLSERLELVLQAVPAGLEGPVRVTAPGLDAPLPSILRALPHTGADGLPRRELVASLPGRLWVAGAQALELTLAPASGPALDSLRLTRADLVSALLRAEAEGLWWRDEFSALAAIEHVRHAGLLGDLPPATRRALLGVAQAQGLAGWLLEGAGAQAATMAPDREGAARESELAGVLTEILARHGRTGRDPVALFAQSRRDTALAPDRRGMLARGLAEACCRAGAMERLAAQAQAEGLLPLAEGLSAWEQSTALPFDLAQGWFRAIRERLDHLASLREGWASTVAIAWTVRQVAECAPALDGSRPNSWEHQAILWSWLGYLESLAGDYWSRSPCVALMEAMAAVLDRPERMPEHLARSSARTALRLWGLSPRFWTLLGEDARAARSPGFAEARALCAALVEEAGAERPDRARIDGHLTRAQALGLGGAERFRRELLGPAGLPEGWPDPDALARRGANADETVLRALMHPDAAGWHDARDPGAGETLCAAVTRGARAAWREVPSAPLGALERRLMAEARALLESPDAGRLDRWAAEAAVLGDHDQGHVGVTLGLGLVAGLARDGAGELAEGLAALLPAPRDTSRKVSVPAWSQALAVLARHAPELAAQTAARLGQEVPALPDDALARGANPLHDTLVAVYSCRPYLDSRVAGARRGWLSDLAALGVPFLVFTGDGQGERVGDTVHLDAPDDYEGLPDKTLAMVRWVLANTGFSRLLKIDDDCHLNAAAWLGDLAPLRHDYYGRPLTRQSSQMNRSWHMAKSRSARGRLELDKSPGSSRYADGGTGYMLSRRAMEALAAAAETPEGQGLRQVSFMEDKLVGDLLALRSIKVSGEDYRASVLRRTSPGGPLVPAWENGPLPWEGSPVKLAHLDDAAQLARAHEDNRSPWPRPGKVWPSYQPARFGSRSNTLDLLSPPERLARARKAPVAVVACLRNEAGILPLFLDHYRRQGVEAFLIADNGSDDGTLDLLAQAPDVALFSVDTPYAQSQFGVAWQQALLSNFRAGQWSLLADADEFLILPEGPASGLPALLDTPAFAGTDAARVLMLDMYPQGPLSQVTLESGDPFAEAGFVDRAPFLRASAGRGPFSDGETLTSALRHRLIPGSRPELFVAQKYALLRYRPWMRLSAGLHFVAEARPAPCDLLFAHFKYTAAFHAKARNEVQRRQHFNNAEEYAKYLALVAEGRETLYDPEVSVPWRDCAEVRRVLDQLPR